MKKTSAVFGTQEWAHKTANCIEGCSHNCRYCYARSLSARFRRRTHERWCEELAKPEMIDRICRGKQCRVMFPSAHDISPDNLALCLDAVDRMLAYGHEILLVSKPHLACIASICNRFRDRKARILFRFTIGSAYDDVLRFWEPEAPPYAERLSCLTLAWSRGFRTSVSCEPMLDSNIDAVVTAVAPAVTDAIWIGKANQLRQRLRLNGYADAETRRMADAVIETQSDENIRALYARLSGHPLVKWKESIKKVVGLAVSRQCGLDL